MSAGSAQHLPDLSAARAAFDAFAPSYRAGFRRNYLASISRRRVWGICDTLFVPGDLVADLGCGPGEDATHLARRGIKVLAVDTSPAMLTEARALYCKAGRCSGSVEFACADLNRDALAEILGGRPVNGALLSFGVVNFIADPMRLFREISTILRPGGFLVVGTFNRWCLTDLLVSCARRHPIPLRWRRQPTSYSVCGIPTAAWARSKAEIVRALPADTPYTDAVAVGSVMLPAYADAALRRYPTIRKLLWRVDRAIEHTRLALWIGDFIWIVARKK